MTAASPLLTAWRLSALSAQNPMCFISYHHHNTSHIVFTNHPTQWGLGVYIYTSVNCDISDSSNGLVHVQHQGIAQSNVDLQLIGQLSLNFK